MQYLDSKRPVEISYSTLPHWQQGCSVQFITWRLADSLPQSKLNELRKIYVDFSRRNPKPWSASTSSEYANMTINQIESWIHHGYGECVLKNPNIRAIVSETFQRYENRSYDLLSYVIMPNHLHLLISPYEPLNRIVQTLKRETAISINQALGRNGQLWQRNYFDRIVRSPRDLEKYMRYIENNPQSLPTSDYTLYVPGLIR